MNSPIRYSTTAHPPAMEGEPGSVRSTRTHPLDRIVWQSEGFGLDPVTGDWYTVTASGLRVIGWLREGMTGETAANRLATLFGISEERASRDVDAFIAQLRHLRLWTGARSRDASEAMA
jgi:hypothetical protein